MRIRLTLDIERSQRSEPQRESQLDTWISDSPDSIRYIGFRRADEIEADE